MIAPSPCPSASRLQRLLVRVPGSDATPTPSVEQAQLILHLDHCSDCQRRLDDLAGANPELLEAARTLRGQSFTQEEPLRRVLDEVSRNVNLLTQFHDPAGHATTPLPLPATLNLLGPLDDYEVTEVLGQGGMGQVLKAHDRALKRWVAIKVLGAHVANDPVARLRFAREAQGVAAVRHENVITIHAVRESAGLPYFIMEYVGGGSLQDLLDHGERLSWRTIARLGAEIAEGLAAAHAQGLIHRDVKPSNILLQEADESRCREPSGTADGPARLAGPTPEPGSAKICDFGLVRIADESRLTVTGVIAGTPMYMAPEQVQGEPLDARADLFGLGSVLYTLCTGREPFRGESPIVVIRQVCEAAPPPIRELNPDIPPWLAAIVERLHAKRREDRFATAAEVAELMRYNLEHPDQPRSVPPAPGARRPRRRLLGRRSLVAAAALLLLGGILLSLFLFRKGPLAARATLRGHKGPIWSVAFSPDGKQLATGSDDTTVRLWDPTTGRQTRVLSDHGGAVFTVAFAHSGQFLLSSDGDGVIHFWDMARGKERAPLAHHNSNARRVVISPDDRTVAIANNLQGIELWDLDSRKLRLKIPGQKGTILALAFAPDGKTLAAGDANGNIRLLDPTDGTERASFTGDALGVRALVFSPDSQTLASCGSRGMEVKLWDVASRQLLASLEGNDNRLMNLALSPDGTLLAAGCRSDKVLLWDVRSRKLLATIPAHQGAVWSVAFSPDGQTLASAGEDRLGKLWDLRQLPAGGR